MRGTNCIRAHCPTGALPLSSLPRRTAERYPPHCQPSPAEIRVVDGPPELAGVFGSHVRVIMQPLLLSSNKDPCSLSMMGRFGDLFLFKHARSLFAALYTML